MKKFLIILLLAATCLDAYSHDFDKDLSELSNWKSYTMVAKELPRGAVYKTIEFKQNYSISGYFIKGMLADGQIVKIYDTEYEPFLLLEGIVSYDNNQMVVTGVKYKVVKQGVAETYGDFDVSNSDGNTMSYNSKRAGIISITDKDIKNHKGFYLECPTIVLCGEYSEICVDGKTGGRSYSYFSAPLPNNILQSIRYDDFTNLLLKTSKSAFMRYDESVEFEGTVSPFLKDSTAVFFNFLSGRKSNIGGFEYMQVNESGNTLSLTFFNNPQNKKIASTKLIVDDKSLINKESWWNSDEYYKNLSNIRYEYRNGDSYYGKATVECSEDGKPSSISVTRGVYYYASGDKFKGNVNGRTSSGYYIDGETIFKNGKTVNGDWLSKYRFTKEQWSEISKLHNPTAALELAEQFNHEKSFIDYRIKPDRDNGMVNESMDYFSVEDGCNRDFWGIKAISYNVSTGYYSLKDSDGETRMDLKIDNQGKHLVEILYESGKPKYINELSYYPDGTIEKVRIYSYSSRLLYRVCNFFSDGILRSAYEYREDGKGNVIIRMSKEPDPIFTSSYTSKLYDFNGNYERSITWKFGEKSGLFDTYTTKVEIEPFSLANFEKGRYVKPAEKGSSSGFYF